MTGRSILITGCSSGIGRHAALGMRARGWRVFATARSADDVVRLADEGLEAFRLDYADADSIAAAIDTVLGATGGTLDVLFNNGGYAQPGALEDLETALFRAQFEANVFGWHDLTRRVIPVMRKQGRGRIVFNASVLGFVAGRFRGAYVASKHAIEGYADTLRIELMGTGIEVVIIEPGPIESRFRATAAGHGEGIDVAGSVHREAYERDLAGRRDGPRRDRFRKGPEAVLEALVRAVESRRPRARYRVTTPTKVAALLKRILPTRAMDRIVGRVRR
ncbi:MAG TPA: SDR family NAD(P)-dependent oxidoreductase [Bauldia sp.]|nr:SDR family NAD(P)-dependent oxidoreductase [Bauldia sp.]